MNENKESDLSRRSPLSYELIVRKNKAQDKKDGPHLILRKQRTDQEEPQPAAEGGAEEVEETKKTAPLELTTAQNISDYISSLHNHVPDDVIRVVDAIIEEEEKIPTNLPKLDDQLEQIFPGSDVKDFENEEFFYEKKDELSEEAKSSTYKKRVEYEDL